MPNPSRNHRSTSVVSSRSSKSRTPLSSTSHRSSPIDKPAKLLRDLKHQAMWMPPTDFELPTSLDTLGSKLYRATNPNGVKSTTGEKAELLKKAKIVKKEAKKTDETASTSLAPPTLKREVIISSGDTKLQWIDRYKLSSESIPREVKDEFLKTGEWRNPKTQVLAGITVRPTGSSKAVPAPPPVNQNCIISLKPADSSLLPPVVKSHPLEIKQKKCALESFVKKLKKDGDGWRISGGSDIVSSSSSASPSPPLVVSASSSTESTTISSGERKNKRKSNEPYRIYSEAELAAMELAEKMKPKKGGKKKKAKKVPPPKKKKAAAKEKKVEEEQVEQIAPIQMEDDLPPRIVVEGQEPGTVLEWYEEEIIILRAGESPEQRPPIMKRKMAPMEIMKEATPPKARKPKVRAASVLGKSMDERDFFFDDTQSDLDLTLPLYCPRQSSCGPSLNISVIDQVMNSIASTSSVNVVKRDSMESTSSLESNATGCSSRSKRAIRIRARYSPTPEETALTRCNNQMGVEANGLLMSQQISPI